MNKEIYLIVTFGCSACKCQEYILNKVAKDINFKLNVLNFQDTPDWIKTNVPINDFPITVIVINNVIKYHFTGTKSIKQIKEIIKNY